MVLYEKRRCWKCVEVRDLLDRLGLEYESVRVGLEPGAEDLIEAWTGMPLVPVLRDGDMVVWDRRRILRYLEETYGGAAPGPPLPDWMGGVRTLSDEAGPRA